MIEELLGGGIKTIRYIKNHIPSDIANSSKFDNISEQNSMEMLIKAKRTNFLSVPPWLRDFFNGQAYPSDYLEIDNIVFDELKLEIGLDGKKKTVSLSDLHKISPSLDITNEVDIKSDGHPSFESIRGSVAEIGNAFAAEIRWVDYNIELTNDR